MWNGTSRGRWSSVGRSFMGFAAHSLLLSFTIGLSFKLNRTLSFCSWWSVSSIIDRSRFIFLSIQYRLIDDSYILNLHLWIRLIFIPLWLFHAFTARGRFSIPAPSVPKDRHVRISSSILFRFSSSCSPTPFDEHAVGAITCSSGNATTSVI